MDQRFAYFAYGLRIRAAFELWPWANDEPAAGAPQAEIEVRFAGPSEHLPRSEFRPGSSAALLEWPLVGAFSISHGQTIRVLPAPGATIAEIALIAAGPALALLLEQRGHVVLHGSCVEIAGAASALLGPSGAGKSTIAATLRERGHSLVSDGMTVLDVSGSEPLALAGPPHLKLWADAVQSLTHPPLETRPVVRQPNKRWYEARGATSTRPVPLRRAILLEPGDQVSYEALAPGAGLVGLVKNYFLADFADAQSQEFVLRRCARIASAVSISVLRRGQGLGQLPEAIARLVD